MERMERRPIVAQSDRPDPRSARDRACVEVAREMTRLYRDQFGRGPRTSRAYWAGDDVIIGLLEGTLTPAERNLADMGEHQRLRDVRLFFQYASEAEFRSSVERAVGRPVRAFISGIDAAQDVAAELFVLAPAISAPTSADV